MSRALLVMTLLALAGCGADGKPIPPGSKDATVPVAPATVVPGAMSAGATSGANVARVARGGGG